MPSINAIGPNSQPPDRVRWWQYLLAILLVLGGLALATWIIRSAVKTFTALPQGTSAAIVTGSATVLVAVVTVLVSRYFERRSNAEQAQRDKRIPVYEDFVKGLLDLIGATRSPEDRKDPSPKDVYEIFARFTEQLLVWGSDDVIREWVTYRNELNNASTDEDNLRNLLRLEDLFLAIRRDLGLRSKSLRRGDLLRLWINDLDD